MQLNYLSLMTQLSSKICTHYNSFVTFITNNNSAIGKKKYKNPQEVNKLLKHMKHARCTCNVRCSLILLCGKRMQT